MTLIANFGMTHVWQRSSHKAAGEAAASDSAYWWTAPNQLNLPVAQLLGQAGWNNDILSRCT